MNKILMSLFFAMCALAFVQCNTPYKKGEVFDLLDQIIEKKYGLDPKRSKCMMKNIRDRTKHKNLASNVSRTLEPEEFEAYTKPFVDIALYDCTAYSWFIFFISAISFLGLICLSMYLVHCICLKVKEKE